jgi:transcriptional regulator with XRE-family HTH domain
VPSPHPQLIRFGERVRAARVSRGMSQESLAELTGLHRTYVGGIERGERNLGLINLTRVAAALKVSVGSLVD